uniref:ribonuclease H n=1 Tax=Erpetoichthys calabaricus TaxID=27687 RepID=A0A8C4TMG7_ERPCA
MLASLPRLIKHHEAKIIFKDTNCLKTSYNHHSIACHQTKCKKNKKRIKTKCLTCSTCGDQFGTNRGLGQHIRHPKIWKENFMNPTDKEIWLEDTTNLLLKMLLDKSKDKKSKPISPKHVMPSKKQVPKRILKKYQYKRAQTLYKKDKAHLASEILDSITRKKCEISLDKINEHFNGVWGSRSETTSVFMAPISASEVQTATYNLWLLAGAITKAFKKARTLLLPKSTEVQKLSNNNWRPITIGSLITRIFSKILYTRLKSGILLNPRQKGFMDTVGCSENIQTLQAIIMAHKTHQKSLGMVFIDFEKAFDTVSHAYLFRILRIMRLDTHISQLFRDMYSGASNCVENYEGNTTAITLMRGVKQGDDLSPLFFNIAIDPLIHKLESDGSGTFLGETTITAMAFADDLVLVSNTWGGMKRNLNILKEFCREAGLKLQPAKCKGFFFTWKNRKMVVKKTNLWKLDRIEMKRISSKSPIKYLGINVERRKGVFMEDPQSELEKWSNLIGKAPLKPIQKINIFNQYAIPRLLYSLLNTNFCLLTIRKLDVHIRKTIKTWLHLPQCTSNGVIYSKRTNGGLSVLKLEAIILKSSLKTLGRITLSEDPILQETCNQNNICRQLNNLRKLMGGTPTNFPNQDLLFNICPNQIPSDVPIKFRDWRQAEFDSWKRLPIQGLGIDLFEEDKVSNCWLYSHKWMSQGQFIAAIQVRANVFPTRETISRESVSHILGQCPALQKERIARHHKLCSLLANECETHGWFAHQEHSVKLKNGRSLRPDLILIKNKDCIVIDLPVRYEFNIEEAQRAKLSKEKKYEKISPLIREEFGALKVQTFGLVVGARGKWYGFNNKPLKLIGLSTSRILSFSKLMSRRSLLYSLDMLSAFSR